MKGNTFRKIILTSQPSNIIKFVNYSKDTYFPIKRKAKHKNTLKIIKKSANYLYKNKSLSKPLYDTEYCATDFSSKLPHIQTSCIAESRNRNDLLYFFSEQQERERIKKEIGKINFIQKPKLISEKNRKLFLSELLFKHRLKTAKVFIPTVTGIERVKTQRLLTYEELIEKDDKINTLYFVNDLLYKEIHRCLMKDFNPFYEFFEVRDNFYDIKENYVNFYLDTYQAPHFKNKLCFKNPMNWESSLKKLVSENALSRETNCSMNRQRRKLQFKRDTKNHKKRFTFFWYSMNDKKLLGHEQIIMEEFFNKVLHYKSNNLSSQKEMDFCNLIDEKAKEKRKKNI